MRTNPISVMIADDSDLVRYSIKHIINQLDEFTIYSEAENGKQVIDLLDVSIHKPDILLLDICLPSISGYFLLPLIKNRWPDVKVIVLSNHCGSYSINYMLSFGASAYVSKKSALKELPEILPDVALNGRAYSTVAPYQTFADLEKKKITVAKLSPQQSKLLSMICCGFTDKEIADKMNLSVCSVESYLKEIKKKLQIRVRTHLINFAYQNEMIF